MLVQYPQGLVAMFNQPKWEPQSNDFLNSYAIVFFYIQQFTGNDNVYQRLLRVTQLRVAMKTKGIAFLVLII